MRCLMMRASHFLRTRIIIILHVSYRELFVRTIHRTVTRFHSKADFFMRRVCKAGTFIWIADDEKEEVVDQFLLLHQIALHFWREHRFMNSKRLCAWYINQPTDYPRGYLHAFFFHREVNPIFRPRDHLTALNMKFI